MQKWLKAAGSHASDELSQFNQLQFYAGVAFGTGYNPQDQKIFTRDCDRTVNIIESAIENLSIGLKMDTARPPAKKNQGRTIGSVTIGQAGSVVMGDRNVVAMINQLTVSDFLKILEEKVESSEIEPAERKTLLQKLKEFSENPMLNMFLGQTLAQFLKSQLGG